MKLDSDVLFHLLLFFGSISSSFPPFLLLTFSDSSSFSRFSTWWYVVFSSIQLLRLYGADKKTPTAGSWQLLQSKCTWQTHASQTKMQQPRFFCNESDKKRGGASQRKHTMYIAYKPDLQYVLQFLHLLIARLPTLFNCRRVLRRALQDMANVFVWNNRNKKKEWLDWNSNLL